MKYRTFVMTLSLFLIAFNLGIFVLTVVSYRDTIRAAEEKSLGEHYFTASALIKDFYAVESRGAELEGVLGDVLQPYGYLTGDQKVRLVLYRGDMIVYANRMDRQIRSEAAKPPEDGSRRVTVGKSEGRTFATVTGKLPSPYDAYTLVYQYDATESVASWKQMKNMLFFAGIVLSGLLAIGLMIVLDRIFKPLSRISRTSRQIAAGAYETRLPVEGRDELSEMARSFNHMAEEIQRQMTELIAEAEKKQRFIDNFAHELRTPLTAIYGYAEYMQKAALSEEDKLSSLSYIMSESRRLQTMAYQLLELANLNRERIAWETHDFSELLQSVRRTLQGKLEDKSIRLEILMDTGKIRGDAALLQSLFINLIDNAIKACDQDGRICVQAAEEAGKLTVSVRDDGKGMPADMLDRITEPFYRAEKSRSRKDGGAGLGLAICKQIARSHGAELAFRSRPGEGTTAWIVFTTSK